MLAVPVGRILLANQPIDLRKSFDGLAALVESDFSIQPNSGDLFVFLNKRKTQVRMLFWDRDGFCILMKRLEIGTFQRILGEAEETQLEIDRGQLLLLLEGIVAEQLRFTKRYKMSIEANSRVDETDGFIYKPGVMSLDDAAILKQLLAEREVWLREGTMLKASLEEKDRSLEEKVRSLENATLRLEEKEQELRGASELTQRLQEQVKALLAQSFGRRSEKLTDEEVGQLVLAFGGNSQGSDTTIPNTPPEDAEHPERSEDRRGKRKEREYKNGHSGRRLIDESIERVVEDILVPAEQRACPPCNQEMKCFKHIEHTRLEYVPAKIVAHGERREVLGCSRTNCKAHVEIALSKHNGRKNRILGYSMLARMVEQRCLDSIPIDRQHDQWKRRGVNIPVNTLYSGWNWALDLLSVVGHSFLGDILSQPYVRVDDTGLVVLDRHVSGGSRRGHLWFFVDAQGRVGVTLPRRGLRQRSRLSFIRLKVSPRLTTGKGMQAPSTTKTE